MNFMSAIILSISAKVSAIIGILTKCLIIGYTAAIALKKHDIIPLAPVKAIDICAIFINNNPIVYPSKNTS